MKKISTTFVLIVVLTLTSAACKGRGNSGAVPVSAGVGSSFALKADGSLWAWGLNSFGQLGDGTTKGKATPVKIMDSVASVSAGAYHAAAIKTDGSLWAWGDNSCGQLGNGSSISTAYKPVYISGGVIADTSEKPSVWAETQVGAAIAANIAPQSLQENYAQPMTRAEFCALAVTLYENIKGEIASRRTFADTNDVNVEKAAAIGVVNGTDTAKNLFSPDNELTREQAAAMLARLSDAIDKPLPKQAAISGDKDTFSPWAVESIGQVQAAGIMSGTNAAANVFSPKDPYTREQSIVTVMRLYDIVK